MVTMIMVTMIMKEEHEMGLEIIGVSIGSTSFKLELMHDSHADYTSTNNIPIIVK